MLPTLGRGSVQRVTAMRGTGAINVCGDVASFFRERAGGQEGDVPLNLVNPPERVGTFV